MASGRVGRCAGLSLNAVNIFQKLGVKPDSVVTTVDAPEGYAELIQIDPANLNLVSSRKKEIDVVHLFVKKRARLEERLPKLMQRIKQNGMIWVSWPKKSSKVPTDVTEDVVRDVALPMDLVDVKVCAVDATWSALKLVIRKEKRV